MTAQSYTVDDDTRAALALFADDLIDIAAKGEAPDGATVALMIVGVLRNGYTHEGFAEDEWHAQPDDPAELEAQLRADIAAAQARLAELAGNRAYVESFHRGGHSETGEADGFSV